MIHRGDDHILDDTIEAVRMEVERLDFAVNHYENTPMQYTEICCQSDNKMKISLEKNDIFRIFAQNIDCGYMLEHFNP